MKRKKFFSNKEVEDPERLARTVFVGNLPVALTKRVCSYYYYYCNYY